MLEYNLIKQHQPRFNIRLKDDKSYPFLAVTLDDEWPRAMVMRGAQAQGRPLLRALRPRLRHPRDARPAAAHASRSAPAPTTSSTATSASGGRACCSTSRSAAGPCVGEIDREPTTTRWCTSSSSSSTATPTTVVHRLEAEMQAAATSSSSSGRPACATASARCARPSRSSRWWSSATRTSTSIGLADDELEAVGPGVLRAQGPGASAARASCVDKVEDLTPGRARRPHPRGALRRRAAAMGVPKQVLVPVEPDDPALYEEWLTHRRGLEGRRSGCPSGATSATLLETVTRNAEEEFARHRLRRAADHNSRAAGAQRAPGPPRPARGPAAHRVLRHEPPPGHRLRRLDGGARGRPAQEARVPPLQDQGRRRATTTSRRWRRC